MLAAAVRSMNVPETAFVSFFRFNCPLTAPGLLKPRPLIPNILPIVAALFLSASEYTLLLFGFIPSNSRRASARFISAKLGTCPPAPLIGFAPAGIPYCAIILGLKIAEPPPLKLGTICSPVLATIVPRTPPPKAKLGIATGLAERLTPPTPRAIS